MAQQKRLVVEWNEFHSHAQLLAWKIAEKGSFKGIIAVTRGGMVPATIVARELDVYLIDTFCAASYGKKSGPDKAKKLKVFKIPQVAQGGKGMLVIDDLSDEGSTFRYIRTQLPNAHYAAVYAKPKALDAIDTYTLQVSQGTWIDFPWELKAKRVATARKFRAYRP